MTGSVRTLLAVTAMVAHLSGDLAAAAQPSPPEIAGAARQAAERRESLAAALRQELQPDEKGVFYLAGVRPADFEESRQTSDFYYLTGLTTPGAGLLIVLDEGSVSERLYLPERDPQAERWTGTALGPGGIDPNALGPDAERRRTMEATGFIGSGRSVRSGVAEIGSMRTDLSAHLASGRAVLFLHYEPPALDDPPTPESLLVSEVRARYPQARIAPVREALARLRLVKSADEIEAIRRAVAITCEAQRAAMRSLRPGMKEYEIEAVVEYVFTKSGARHSAFPTIVGSGPNSCVLHYTRNDRTIEKGDLVVIDAGAEYARYAADVTRTLPASGRFSDEQMRVYRAVLRAQSEAKDLVRPGAKIKDIHEAAAKVLEEAGLKERLLHGCCHFVGLDVHDVGSRDVDLEPGMVLTVEPGVYIPEKEIGVRIEDMFLVTEKGYEQLSACVPSAPEDVAAEMSRRVDPSAVTPAGEGSPR